VLDAVKLYARREHGMKFQPTKLVALISIILVLNAAAYDFVGAADKAGDRPDSSAVKPGKLEAPAPSAAAKGIPIITPEDNLQGPPPVREPAEKTNHDENAGTGTPFYKNKWVWAACATVLAGTATAIIVTRGEKAGKTLPDFPQPPTR
jgi:hypothetical protein